MDLGPKPVGCLVSLKMGLLPEGLVTQRATEWSHIFMHAHVHHQVVRFGEGLTTEIKLKIIFSNLNDIFFCIFCSFTNEIAQSSSSGLPKIRSG